MRSKIFVLSIAIICISCKGRSAESATELKPDMVVTKASYPEHLSKVFDAHGGLELWKQMRTLKFTIAQVDGLETTTVNLKSRTSVIDMPNHILGYNGTDVWLHDKDTITYKGNPKFYNNLMFYFFAMPFVMADKGINYAETLPLMVDGQTYPGIRINFDGGIGESPDDEYILYYDKDTHKLMWLSYTVTYFRNQQNKEFYFLKYNNWQNVNGLWLPETMTWYHAENNVPTTTRNEVRFVDVDIAKQGTAPELFEKPEGGAFVK